MHPWSRRSLLATLGTLAGAGCLTDSEESPDTPTGTTPAPTTWSQQGSTEQRAETTREPEADHAIRVQNDGTTTRDIAVEVVRADGGTTVFSTVATVAPDEEITLFNLRETNPVGVEAFRIHASVIDTDGTATATGSSVTTREGTFRASAYLETSECFGDAIVIWYGSSLGVVFSAIC